MALINRTGKPLNHPDLMIWGEEYFDAANPFDGHPFRKIEVDFIESALNSYFHEAIDKLQRKDLGDLERIMYEKQRDKSKWLMKKIHNL